jgi:hypothetical protein
VVLKRLALILLAFLSFAGCTFTSLPPIEDPMQLLLDAEALATAEKVGSIPPDKWPDSIQKLKPATVTKEETGIYITTLAQPGTGARCYAKLACPILIGGRLSLGNDGHKVKAELGLQK